MVRRHLPLVVLLVLLAIVVRVAMMRVDESAGEETTFPRRPPLGHIPPGATQYAGLAGDGSRVVIRRNGRYVWMRVDSAPTYACDPGDWQDFNFVVMDGHIVNDERFAFRGPVSGVSGDRIPRWVHVAVIARFEDGRARGWHQRFDLVDTVTDEQIRCTRSISFDVPRATEIPPRPPDLD